MNKKGNLLNGFFKIPGARHIVRMHKKLKVSQTEKIQEKINKAEWLIKGYDYKGAQKIYENILKKNKPFNITAVVWLKLGRVYRFRSLFEKAESSLLQGLDIYPNDLRLKVEAAELAMEKKDWGQAAKHLKEVIEKTKDDTSLKTWVKLVKTLRKTSHQKKREAETFAKKGLNLYPESHELAIQYAEIATEAKNWQDSSRRWRDAIKIYEDNHNESAPSLYIRGSEALRFDGEHIKAQQLAESGLAKNPDNTDLKTELALALFHQKDWKRSLECIDEILNVSEVDKNDSTYEKFGQHRILKSAIKRLIELEKYTESIKNYQKKRANNKPRVAIYTAITGNYDSLKLPEVMDDRFDYIVFSDTPMPETGVYDVRSISNSEKDGIRAARYVKTHPHELLKDYDVAIWIDANIMILDDIYSLVEDFIDSGKALAAIPHPLRDTIYEEAQECIARGKDNKDLILKQINDYQSAGFDKKGLIESNFMMFDLNNTDLNKMLDTWWEQITTYSRRDQIGLPYAIAKHNIDYYQLTKRPNSIRNHSKFALMPHSGDKSVTEELNRQVSERLTGNV